MHYSQISIFKHLNSKTIFKQANNTCDNGDQRVDDAYAHDDAMYYACLTPRGVTAPPPLRESRPRD